MDNKEIFIKVVKKALKNGWKILGDENCLELCAWNITNDLDFVIREREYSDEGQATYSMNDIVFSHDFAKAFWGEKETIHCRYAYDTHLECDELLEYEYQLQQMVLEEDPIKYLEKYV